jgi:hypothetical protein
MNEMKQRHTPDESAGLTLSYKTFLSFLGAIVVVVAGATFAVTKLSTSSHVSALQTELDGVKERELRKDTEIKSLRDSPTRRTDGFAYSLALPDATLAAAGDSALANLASRISDLEMERATLLGELAERSHDALDPKSELASLLTRLSTQAPEERMDAVRGLFDLADPHSFNSLVAYFRANPEEATRTKTIYEWYLLLVALDGKGGVEFMIDELQSDQLINAQWAYERLSDESLSTDLLQHAITQLESVALRSADTVVRTRAKLLVQRFRESLANPEPERDPRSLYSLLKDIEAEIKKLTQESDGAELSPASDVRKATPEE